MPNIKNWTFNSDFDVESSVAEFNDNRDRFLNVYFNSIAKLYELSRMNGRGVEQVQQEFLHSPSGNCGAAWGFFCHTGKPRNGETFSGGWQ